MVEISEAIFTDKTSKHIALLQYVADQLRCYSDELSAKDDVLPTFADMLDELASELGPPQSIETAHNAARVAVR